ncbi:Na+/H+ antiporter subunit E [Actinomadura sp. WMMB 499]|uniref:Na+/H+ antiporter subunit E n=1 Tax=Actinomadura sp. WMMB 499 TaxID=1219491 RepID=UPI00159E0A29|nr:Na+/H+ antiporter subunit E [Actinomadura sp. WMMB 499]
MNVLRRMSARAGMAVWLLGVWLLLWGRADAATVLSGVLVALGAYAVTRLPTVPFITRLRPVRLTEAALEFCWDLVASSVVIGKHALWRPGRVRGALVYVRARSRSDVVLLAVTTSMSLRPGTLVLDIDWEDSLFLIHAVPVDGPADAEAVKHDLLGTERRLLRALGAPDPEEPG